MNRAITIYVRSFSTGHHFLDKEEFPKRGQDLKKLWIKAGTTQVFGVEQGLHKILDICQSKPTITDDDPASHRLFQELILAASALADSKFFAVFKADQSDDKSGEDLTSKLWRNLDKIRQYLHIEKLVEFVQDQRRNFTISWVSEEISIPKHMDELRQIEIRKVQEVTVEFGKEHTQIAKTEAQVEKIFESRSLYWKKEKDKFCKNKRIWPKLHAEIQIIHALGEPKTRSSLDVVKPQRAIGCSKRSCLQCWLYMKKINELLCEEWMTAGDHSWPYETAALTGSHPKLDPKGLCDAYVIEMVRKFAISQVKQLYGLQPIQPFHKREKSDENATASGSSDGTSGESDSDSRSESGAKPQSLGRSVHK
ncbi:hypothetical protein C0989_011145 [Termitomyces sp. Mn162]|nr:hypothetical protein C0989_011145 [Termitomyces sp. Mn162]